MQDIVNSHPRRDWYLWCLLLLCLAAHICLSLVGWGNTISDYHGSRQTQTAISTYYTIKEGFRVDYITPILGKPWSIPLEFPLYQWIVAGSTMVSGMPMEQVGRFVTLAFFYLSLVPTYFLLRLFVVNRASMPVFFCLMLASPTYIFWSRTFMIESLALFLSLAYLAAIVNAAVKFRWWLVLVACVAGTLAGLTKVTTFGVFVISAPILVLLCRRTHPEGLAGLPRTTGRIIASAILVLGVPMAVSAWWVQYADVVKSLNPMANGFITSASLRSWNFGTVGQRLDWQTWGHIAYKAALAVSPWAPAALVTFGALFVLAGRYRKEAIFCGVCWLAGPLLFTNLYLVHEYYHYANAVFLLLSLGFLIVSLMEEERYRRAARWLILPGALLMMYGGYYRHYYDIQRTDHTGSRRMAESIRASTNESDIILIYGSGWSSELPYYSQRKALMMYRPLSPDESVFEKALGELARERIGAMVVGGDKRNDADLIARNAKRFNLTDVPALRGWYADLYLPQGRRGGVSEVQGDK